MSVVKYQVRFVNLKGTPTDIQSFRHREDAEYIFSETRSHGYYSTDLVKNIDGVIETIVPAIHPQQPTIIKLGI